MLHTITVNNFAIIDNLELDFEPGMTVLTGETGAGKSIIIDALQYALGARADSSMVRHGCKRADISVDFDINTIPAAQDWLKQHELDDENNCLLRRTINADGGSKQFINGQACTQTQMRELATLLINIHGQHENQNLSNKIKQQQLLDEFASSLSLGNQKNQTTALDKFAKHQKLVSNVNEAFNAWQTIKTEIDRLKNNDSDHTARIDLLSYQINELENLALEPNEFELLAKQQKALSQADNIATDCNLARNLLDNDDNNVCAMLQTAIAKLNRYQEYDPRIANSYKLLDEAFIQSQEALHELESYLDNFESDPEKLHEIEQRMQQIHDLARKHKIEPKELPEKLVALQAELDNLQHADKRIAELQSELIQAEKNYQTAAKKLTTSRQLAAEKFNQQVTHNIQQLGMPNGVFSVNLSPREGIHATGNEKIEFLVASNPGSPAKPISKVASGGELSRISLAIEVITAQNTNTPTLIFDEVDVGIGGGTAEIVGKLLRQLGNRTQVLCITHLPQVAAQGHHHLMVGKTTDGKQTNTTITALKPEQKIQEIARMLGGVKITKQTLAHAEEMLADVV